MRRVSHGNLAISLFSALVVWNVCMVCESQADDASKRSTCNLYLPAHVRATIIKPSESPGIETKNITENDFVREKEINSLTSVDIYPTYVALFECEPGYTLIGNTRLSCIQGQNGTAVLVGNYPTCDINECYWFGTQNNHVKFRFKEQLLSSRSSGFPNGTELIFSDSECPLGQSVNKSSPKITCHQGRWTSLSPNCITESSSCSWVGSKENVLFVFNKTMLNKKSEHYLEGTIAIELDHKETCPPGLVSRQHSVKLCEKGIWNLSEHPCVAPAADSSDARKDPPAFCSHCGLVVWGGTMTTLFCVALIVFILSLGYSRFSHLNVVDSRHKRLIRGSTQDGNRLHAEDAEQLTIADEVTPDPYFFIPEVLVSRTEDAVLVVGDAQSMAIYSELKPKNELGNGDGQATYSTVVPKSKRG